MSLPSSIASRLKIPVIAAPMFLVSGVQLVVEACRAGIIGAFPTINCRSTEELEQWMKEITGKLNSKDAPFAANLVVHKSNSRRDADLEIICRYKPEIVITSVGNPKPVIGPIHDYGGLVFNDVATMKHAESAVESGADGLILLCAGAGGQTGWANPFAFARGIRSFFDGPMVLAGGIADSQSVKAAEVLGCDLAYMGTRFVSTAESLAKERYKEMIRDHRIDDVKLTDKVTGLPVNMLIPSLKAAGLDPENLPERGELDIDRDINPNVPRRWKDVWSSGHSLQLVGDIPRVSELVDRLIEDYVAL